MNLSTKLITGFVLLALFFVGVTLGNYLLARRVLSISERVATSQYMSGRVNLYYRALVDMETGFRGYLLTGREESLDPYYDGQRRLPELETELEATTPATSPQRARLRQIGIDFRVWQDRVQDVVLANRALLRRYPRHTGLEGLPQSEDLRSLVYKRQMDKVRNNLRELLTHESNRRASLTEKLNDATTTTRNLSILLTVLGIGLGLVGALYITRLLTSRVKRQVEWAERLAEGNYSARMEDSVGDELTALSSSLDRMADRMTTAIAQLEARNRELDQFAYIVSHDLKAPLRGIESVSRWIEEDMGADLPPHIQEFLQLMRRRVGRMENLISGILALSRIGRAAETQERVDVAALLADLIDDIAPPPGFRIILPKQLPVLFTNRTALGQVFSNLLSNAIKYHHHPDTGSATLTWRPTAQHHLFTLTDDGPGIAPAYHERIFQIFQTLQERDSVESTGVGLAIVKKIVERHGGTVSVASDEGRGAAFSFTWPLG